MAGTMSDPPGALQAAPTWAGGDDRRRMRLDCVVSANRRVSIAARAATSGSPAASVRLYERDPRPAKTCTRYVRAQIRRCFDHRRMSLARVVFPLSNGVGGRLN